MPLVKNFSTITIALILFTGLNLYVLVKFLKIGQIGSQIGGFGLANVTSSNQNGVDESEKEDRIQLNIKAGENLKLEIKVNKETKNIDIKVISNDNQTKSLSQLEVNLTSLFENSTTTLELCPTVPPNLKTRLPLNLNQSTRIDIEEYLKTLSIRPGGEWSPVSCKPRYKVAIIVPYRNRESNLNIFLRHMHPFLIKQQIDYGIFIIEPELDLPFNRGLLMNVGFNESLNLTNNKWDCFMFHDVDLLPEDERNIYSCPDMPRHMSSAVSTMNYQLPYEGIFGGVSSLTREQMVKVNGFSNLYFGWGGEDDDFRERIVKNGYKISRYPLEIGRYYMAKHERDQKINSQRYQLLSKTVQRMSSDGLNSLVYKLVKVERLKLFTHVVVSYDEKYYQSKIV